MANRESSVDRLEVLELPDPGAWQSWLGANHAAVSGVWLAVGKKGNAVSTLFYDDAIDEALTVGWIDGRARKLDADRFLIHFGPRRPKSAWSAINRDRAERLIAEGRMSQAGFEAIEAARANGSWD